MSAAPELKYTDRDLREDDSLMELAVAYVMNYTGEFEPLLDAREMLEESGAITVPVARKVLNCMRHDARVAMSLPKPRYASNVVDFAPPRRQRKMIYGEAQCDDPEPHHYHHWTVGDHNNQCNGVPWPINRHSTRLPVKVKVRYCASRTGTLIHEINPDGPHRGIWQGPQHAWGFRSDESPWYDSDADLVVKLLCKLPSFLQRPILIREEDLNRFWEIPDVLLGMRAMKLCPHCAKVRLGE